MPLLLRRDFLKVAGGLALASTLPFPKSAAGGGLDKFFGVPARLTPAITPNEEFYATSYRSPPSVDMRNWELTLKGLVERSLTLSYLQLLARPGVAEIVTLECVGNRVAGDAVSTAVWEGASLKTLLAEAGINAKAHDVVFRAADGYSDSITVERALAGDVLVVYRMNGAPLPQGHGFPARIIVPGVYGMKSVQWLTEIELVEQDYQGYYQKQGWSDEATVKTMSRIDLPGHGDRIPAGSYDVKGLAFARTRGIGLVEISTDGGRSWNQARLDQVISPYAWRFWSYQWAIQSSGRHTLSVRATDGTGKLQASTEQDPAPDGAQGLHEITVAVEA